MHSDRGHCDRDCDRDREDEDEDEDKDEDEEEKVAYVWEKTDPTSSNPFPQLGLGLYGIHIRSRLPLISAVVYCACTVYESFSNKSHPAEQ